MKIRINSALAFFLKYWQDYIINYIGNIDGFKLIKSIFSGFVILGSLT